MSFSAGASNPGRRIDPDNPPYRDLRELLQAAFEPDTLRRFCQDDPLFRPLLDRFAHNAGLLDMIDEVFEFCRTQLLWEDLLDAVAEHSPRHYDRFASRMRWGQVSEPEPRGRGDGGTYVEGDVRITDGDFVGRDQKTYIYGAPSGLESFTGELPTAKAITQQESLRLDAALPDQVHLGRVFDLAVAVRQKTSPLLTEDDLTRVHSGDVQIAWTEGEPYARLRLQVSAPECEIHGEDSYSFRLQPGHDSPAFYFHLTPTVLGEIGVIVRLYQEQDCLGSTRVHTVAREQIVGAVQLAITSHPFTGPNPPDDVEIHVGAGSEGRYPVTIQTPQAGDASSALDPLPPAEELRGWLADLEGEQAGRTRQAEIGQALFRTLFPDAIRDRYVAALDESESGVRLRLWLDAPELQALPWELLYDAVDDEFLALSGRALVTRYLSVPRGAPPLAVTPPLRVLVAVASPQGHPGLDVEAEVTAVQEALGPAQAEGLAQVETLPHARVMALRVALRDLRPHVLHFAGHGAVGRDGGALLLEDEAGDPALLSARQLRILIQRSGADVRLAVLNACLTARGAAVEAAALDAQRRALLGVGPALVRAGLGAVVAMQLSLNDASARLFARDFYDAVARLEPVDLAVSRAREALALGAGTDSRDWATPVLFLRARDGVIFAPATLQGP
jgi:hypothetical protein